MTKFGKIILSFVILFIIFVVLFFLTREVKVNNEEEIKIEENIVTQEELYDKTLLEGNFDDLIYFSVKAGSIISGNVNFNGSVKNAYFFEGNILINILDINKNLLLGTNAIATTEWMTEEPVEFEGSIDFTNLAKGPAYIEIQNDDPSGGEGGPAKKILIPIIIE